MMKKKSKVEIHFFDIQRQTKNPGILTTDFIIMNFPKNLMGMTKLAARLSIKFDIFGLKITLGITVFKF